MNVTITKPHEINIEVVKSTVNDLTDEDIAAIEGVSSSKSPAFAGLLYIFNQCNIFCAAVISSV